MRAGFGRDRWPSLAAAVVASLGGVLAVGGNAAEPVRHTITFDKVVVQGFVGIYDTPEVAHLDQVDEVAPPSSGSRQLSKHGPSTRDAGRTSAGPTEPGGLTNRGGSLPATTGHQRAAGRPTVGAGSWGSSISPLGATPGQGTANPSFVEHGFRVEAFWAAKTGTPDGRFKRAHFHPPDLSSGFEALHLGNTNELHGIHISSLDGKAFGLHSLRYRVTSNRQLVWKPFSIEGFSNFNVQLLVARSFDPRRSVREQFSTFSIGMPVGNEPSLPWWMLHVSGFELVDQVYVASSASVDIDDVVVTRIARVP